MLAILNHACYIRGVKTGRSTGKLGYPMSNPITRQNPLGAGRISAGAVKQVTITGLSPELVNLLDQQPSKSAYLRMLIQQDYDRQQNTPE